MCHSGSLANELGNLVHRILTLLRKNLPDPTSPLDLVENSAEFENHPVAASVYIRFHHIFHQFSSFCHNDLEYLMFDVGRQTLWQNPGKNVASVKTSNFIESFLTLTFFLGQCFC